jgi:hypothetical protein
VPVSTARLVRYVKYIQQALFNIFRNISDFETPTLIITNYQARDIAAIQRYAEEEWRYNSTHSRPRSQEEVGGQHHASAALPP